MFLFRILVGLSGVWPVLSTSLVQTNWSISLNRSSCRYLPGDAEWPNQIIWNKLNQTVGGKLVRGIPLGQACYIPLVDTDVCAQVRSQWTLQSLFVADPVNIMSPNWMNDSCNPFFGPSGTCSLGNLATYTINVSSAADVVAGIRFAQEHNIRLTIKNTGHDFLGRSGGAGSLGLWMHHLKQISFLEYSSPLYSGPAARIGAGVEYADLYPTASSHGYRVVGGSCPTVGIVGGFSQGGGHGPLGAAYGLGSDQVLEWEVVTAKGEHLIVTPTENEDLYWALSGGGTGNFAVVLSVTVRAYPDGPVAGAGFSFSNTGNDTAYWTAVTSWLRHLLIFDATKGLTTVWALSAGLFSLDFMTLPDTNTTDQLDSSLSPFLKELGDLEIPFTRNYTSKIHGNFAEHYSHWTTRVYDSNISLAGRLIPRSVVQDTDITLPILVSTLREITSGGAQIIAVAMNVTNGNHTSNAVLPAWRDALFTMSFAKSLPVDATRDAIKSNQEQLNIWQEDLRTIAPGGSYINEATWENPHWKEDYFGPNYDALRKIKIRYDPSYIFWSVAAVGSDEYWRLDAGGMLCRV
ncbi:hypothetical protein F4774DRAFT_425387 [Daldinia eschscholtzii]|nr:hypothetical protein F4774DRAFT_425387 [Daldinia eschscholtzii]